jgi:hypothetical protein
MSLFVFNLVVEELKYFSREVHLSQGGGKLGSQVGYRI